MKINRLLFLTLVFVFVVFTFAAWADDDNEVNIEKVTFFDATRPVGVDSDGLLVSEGEVSGDLEGTITVRGEFAPNPSSNPSLVGFGTLTGFFTIATNSVTWAGSFTGTVTPSGAFGDYLGPGTDGSVIRGTFWQIEFGDQTPTGEPDVFINQAFISGPEED